MRLFGRILGVGFALCGIAILALFVYLLVSEGLRASGDWKLGGFFIVIGLALILAGRYYWRTDPEEPVGPQPTSNFARFLVSHRYQLKVLSQTGVALSFIAFTAGCFRYESTKWTCLPLLIGALMLNSFAKTLANPDITDNRDWIRVPGWIRQALPSIEKALKAAWTLVFGLILVNQWLLHSALSDRSAYRVAVLLVLYGFAASMYALQALFFQYGDLRDESDLTAT
jgi:hypothetical protein